MFSPDFILARTGHTTTHSFSREDWKATATVENLGTEYHLTLQGEDFPVHFQEELCHWICRITAHYRAIKPTTVTTSSGAAIALYVGQIVVS